MVAFEPTCHYQTLEDWIEGAIQQHSRYLTYQSYLGGEKISTPETPINDPPNSNGSKVLQRTKMPWILPLDVPVPGLP